MGNEPSARETRRVELQSQDSDHLWTIVHQGGQKGKDNDGEEEVEEEEEEERGVTIFAHSPGEGSQADLCKSGVEHLRLLRHPNILKFLHCDKSRDFIVMVTEPVVPLSRVVGELNMEGVVMGCRNIAVGLNFLHSKASLSHNNLCTGSVFVSVTNSLWKLGGFEAAQKHSKLDTKFLESVSSIRDAKAIPPEDQSSPHPHGSALFPCHSRDVWGFGHLILTLLEDSGLDNSASDTLFTYIQDKMLNPDPQLRPTVAEVLAQPWMSNEATEIGDFLSSLTMKTRSEKDQFFKYLASRLHTLPSSVVAEYLVPLLLTPIVMAEPVAQECLWKHLLTPVSSSHPRPKNFSPRDICPLLEKELFVAHVSPLLFNLFESRDLHVRLVLLEHMDCFVNVFDYQDLTDTVLPEVLIGLKETRDEVVSGTLHALGSLVPLLGGDAVLGTERDPLFVDTKPRDSKISVAPLAMPQGDSLHSPPPSSLHSTVSQPTALGAAKPPSHKVSREERMERMRIKREQQKKRMAERQKLGGKIDNSEMESSRKQHAPNYSPTASQDEEKSSANDGSGEEEEEKEEKETEGGSTASEEESWDDFEDERSELLSKADHSPSRGLLQLGNSSGSSHGETGGFEEGVFESGSGWGGESSSSTVPTSGGGGWSLHEEKKTQTSSESSDVSASGKKRTASSQSRSPRSGISLNKIPTAKKGSQVSDSVRGRLSAKDIERLEEQASWSREPDFFADMTPSISVSSKASSQGGTGGSESSTPASSGAASSLAMQYQPSDHEDGAGWGGEEDWNDF